MNKENILYGVIGLLVGLIIGFMFANSVNRNSTAPNAAATMPQTNVPPNANMPAGHPDINGQQQTGSAPMPDIQPAIDNAKNNPTSFEAQIKVAELYNQAEKYEEAAEYLKVANKLNPEHYETIVNLGNVSFDSGNFDEAEKWYTAALVKKKDDANVRTDLGLTYVFRENPEYDKAIKEFQTVLTAEPNHIQALQNMTVAFVRKGDGAKAKETLTKLEAVDPANLAIPKLKEQVQKL